MKRQVLIGGGLAAIAILASSFIVWRQANEPTTTKEDDAKVTSQTNDSNLTVGDVTTASVKDVRSQSKDPTERYNIYFSYAISKESLEKYDAAIEYYKAASEESVDTTKKQDAQFRIYRLAKLQNNTKLADQYSKLLGATVVQMYESKGTKEDEK